MYFYSFLLPLSSEVPRDFQKVVLALPQKYGICGRRYLRLLLSLKFFWPQFSWLWFVNVCTAFSKGMFVVKGVLSPVSVVSVLVGMFSCTVFWPLLMEVCFQTQRYSWRISLGHLWLHNCRMAISEVGPSWKVWVRNVYAIKTSGLYDCIRYPNNPQLGGRSTMTDREHIKQPEDTYFIF